jgi:hypothetical protein
MPPKKDWVNGVSYTNPYEEKAEVRAEDNSGGAQKKAKKDLSVSAVYSGRKVIVLLPVGSYRYIP